MSNITLKTSRSTRGDLPFEFYMSEVINHIESEIGEQVRDLKEYLAKLQKKSNLVQFDAKLEKAIFEWPTLSDSMIKELESSIECALNEMLDKIHPDAINNSDKTTFSRCFHLIDIYQNCQYIMTLCLSRLKYKDPSYQKLNFLIM